MRDFETYPSLINVDRIESLAFFGRVRQSQEYPIRRIRY